MYFHSLLLFVDETFLKIPACDIEISKICETPDLSNFKKRDDRSIHLNIDKATFQVKNKCLSVYKNF
ncbi:hypothetical protein APP_27750 [Aeribacillus pallidus]|jgi:hypothetical protein|nr:hypothetical protein APP_27750 [Aeribacillus pallidus]